MFAEPNNFVKSDLEEKPIMVITTDDNHIFDYIYVYPILRKRAIPVTSYIIPARMMGIAPDGYPANLWNQPDRLHFMADRGWDFQCHTFNHLNLNLLTEQEIHESMQLVDQYFATNNLGTADHCAYPLGAGTAEYVLPIVSQYRLSTRTTFDDGNPYPYSMSFYQMNSQAIDFRTRDQLETAKAGLDQAIAENKIYITNGHFAKYAGAKEKYEEKIEYLEEFLDYAIEKGIRIMTMKECYEYVTARQ